MRICSLTLTSNRESIIGDALRSVVRWVDACLVIDLGITDGTLEVARAVCGRKLIVVPPPAMTLPFFAWRNYALDVAATRGFAWGVTLDTDERLHVPVNVRAQLKRSPYRMIRIYDRERGYPKERFFKLPFRGRWAGFAHEYTKGEANEITWTGATFVELDKTPEQLQTRAEGLIPNIERDLLEAPDDPRNLMYLGDSLIRLGRLDEARIPLLRAATVDPEGYFGNLAATMIHQMEAR